MEKNMIEVLIALFVKHFLADYAFNQIPSNKHIYGSQGSFRHLAIHMSWCFPLLIWLLPLDLVITATFIDGFIHYHLDYIKSKIVHKNDFSVHTRRIITGFDQLLHLLTYVLIAHIVTW
jgi:hypothetical protein|tara:strand:+ start:1132 stop:1488 length:357 start_codon:yes stop_codon:yes gene_type:complete